MKERPESKTHRVVSRLLEEHERVSGHEGVILRPREGLLDLPLAFCTHPNCDWEMEIEE